MSKEIERETGERESESTTKIAVSNHYPLPLHPTSLRHQFRQPPPSLSQHTSALLEASYPPFLSVFTNYNFLLLTNPPFNHDNNNHLRMPPFNHFNHHHLCPPPISHFNHHHLLFQSRQLCFMGRVPSNFELCCQSSSSISLWQLLVVMLIGADHVPPFWLSPHMISFYFFNIIFCFSFTYQFYYF